MDAGEKVKKEQLERHYGTGKTGKRKMEKSEIKKKIRGYFCGFLYNFKLF
jgi:hypothetical protein